MKYNKNNLLRVSSINSLQAQVIGEESNISFAPPNSAHCSVCLSKPNNTTGGSSCRRAIGNIPAPI